MKYVRGISGGVIAGALGAAIYWFLLTRGIHAPILVPGVIGLGCGLGFAAKRDWRMGAISAAMAVIVTLVIDIVWYLQHVRDGSVTYYLTHLHQLNPIYLAGVRIPLWVVYGIGAALAFWFGLGREYLGKAQSSPPPSEPEKTKVIDAVDNEFDAEETVDKSG